MRICSSCFGICCVSTPVIGSADGRVARFVDVEISRAVENHSAGSGKVRSECTEVCSGDGVVSLDHVKAGEGRVNGSAAGGRATKDEGKREGGEGNGGQEDDKAASAPAQDGWDGGIHDRETVGVSSNL